MIMNVLGWKAWYKGGRIFSSGDDLPEENCVGFVVYYDKQVTSDGPCYRDLIIGGDWYLVRKNGQVEVSGYKRNGTWATPPSVKPGERLIRSAKTLPDEEWARVRAEMLEAAAWL